MTLSGRDPTVSVVIPTCRRPVELAEAVDSVIAQTFSDWECLVVDASGDGPSSISPRPSRDPRVSYVGDQRVRGRRSAAAARNAGVRAARGSLIAFLDDDDIWLPDKLERQVAVFEAEPDVQLVFSHMERFGQRSGVWPDVSVPERLSFAELLGGNLIPTSACVVRRAALDEVGLFDVGLAQCEDYELWLRVARFGPLRSLPDVHVRYREHAGSLSRDVAGELESLGRIYRRALREWGVPRAWVRPARRGYHHRCARHASSPIEALVHRFKARLC